jgi:hypothetical protein
MMTRLQHPVAPLQKSMPLKAVPPNSISRPLLGPTLRRVLEVRSGTNGVGGQSLPPQLGMPRVPPPSPERSPIPCAGGPFSVAEGDNSRQDSQVVGLKPLHLDILIDYWPAGSLLLVPFSPNP